MFILVLTIKQHLSYKTSLSRSHNIDKELLFQLPHNVIVLVKEYDLFFSCSNFTTYYLLFIL